jgi:hypothetical protein
MDSVTKVIAEYASTSAFAQLSKEAIHAANRLPICAGSQP